VYSHSVANFFFFFLLLYQRVISILIATRLTRQRTELKPEGGAFPGTCETCATVQCQTAGFSLLLLRRCTSGLLLRDFTFRFLWSWFILKLIPATPETFKNISQKKRRYIYKTLSQLQFQWVAYGRTALLQNASRKKHAPAVSETSTDAWTTASILHK
jgi:hypothetical protein